MRTLLLLLAPVLFAQSDVKYSIQGRIIDDINHAGVARAKLTLKGGGLKSELTATSADNGGFSFPDLAAGSYRLSIEKAGFFPQPYEDSIDVGSTPRTELGDIAIVTQRTISGIVRWADGESVGGTNGGVAAVQVKGGPNGLQFKKGAGAVFNDRGEFHITGLHPGRYVLFSELTGQFVGPDQKPHVLPNVFYPGSDTPNPNISVDLRNAAEFSGVSMVWEEEPGVDIEGMIAPSASDPPDTRVGVCLKITYDIPDIQCFIWFSGHPGEPFRFHNIPPGRYFLMAHISRPTEGFFSGGYRRNMQPLVVGSAPITGLIVAPPASTPITGQVETEDADGKISPAANVRISTGSSKLGMYGSDSSGTTDADGVFRRKDTTAGEAYELRVTPPSGDYVAKITQGGRDLTGNASVTEGGGEVRILLKKDGGTITGRVQQSDGTPARGFVVLAPKNRKAADRFLTTTAARDGSFKLSGIAPGDYDLFAFDQNEDDFYFDDTYLRKFKPTAVSIAPGATASVTINK